jgi:hypothetical protein
MKIHLLFLEVLHEHKWTDRQTDSCVVTGTAVGTAVTDTAVGTLQGCRCA